MVFIFWGVRVLEYSFGIASRYHCAFYLLGNMGFENADADWFVNKSRIFIF